MQFWKKELGIDLSRWETKNFPLQSKRTECATPQKVTKSEEQFGKSHWEGLAIYIGQGVFLVGSETFSDVILMPSEESDGFADGDKLQTELHLSTEPDVIPDDAIFGRVGAALPNLATKEK